MCQKQSIGQNNNKTPGESSSRVRLNRSSGHISPPPSTRTSSKYNTIQCPADIFVQGGRRPFHRGLTVPAVGPRAAGPANLCARVRLTSAMHRSPPSPSPPQRPRDGGQEAVGGRRPERGDVLRQSHARVEGRDGRSSGDGAGRVCSRECPAGAEAVKF